MPEPKAIVTLTHEEMHFLLAVVTSLQSKYEGNEEFSRTMMIMASDLGNQMVGRGDIEKLLDKLNHAHHSLMEVDPEEKESAREQAAAQGFPQPMSTALYS